LKPTTATTINNNVRTHWDPFPRQKNELNDGYFSVVCAATSLANPCTAEALKKGKFYHAFPLDSHSYVQCDASGTPHIRPCPASLVWSAAEVTCVRSTATMSAKTPGGGGKWQDKMTSGSKQQQQQQSQGSKQQTSDMNSWKPAASWMVGCIGLTVMLVSSASSSSSFYYRAMLRTTRYCHGKLSVRPSVFMRPCTYLHNTHVCNWPVTSVKLV